MESLIEKPTAPPTIPLKDTKELACECGCTAFTPLVSMREVSAVFTGTGKNEVVPAQYIGCAKCFKKFEPPKIIV